MDIVTFLYLILFGSSAGISFIHMAFFFLSSNILTEIYSAQKWVVSWTGLFVHKWQINILISDSSG